MPGATPWERVTSEPDGGNHTDGVTVADLFARVTGEIPRVLQHQPTPEVGSAETQTDQETHDWPEEQPTSAPSAARADHDPPTVLTPSAYASEIPDLAKVTPRRVAPEQVGAPPASKTAGHVKAAGTTKRKHRPMLLAGRLIAALFAVLALVLTGGAWQWTATKNNRLNNVAALDPNSLDILDPNAQFGDENFLIVGVDSRYGQNGEMGAGSTEDAGGTRSDSVILVNIPANRKRVVAVSFPRDLAITPMKCQVWDASTGKYGPVYNEQTGTYSEDEVYTETKLNSAYAFGGPKCLVKVIQKISGLSINRFMAVDFAGFAKMVDALGGVEVCSTTPLEDYELGTVLANAGRQTVDSTTALNYVRARKVTTEVNGDYGRIKRQQLFLSSLLRSLISKETFFSLSKLNNVVNVFINDSYVDNITTKDLVDLGQSLQRVSAGRITFITVPTTGITDLDGNEEPRTEDIRALFDSIINDDALPGENDKNETTTPVTNSASGSQAWGSKSPATETPSTEVTQEARATSEMMDAVTTNPQDVSVHVSNSTGQSGLGSTASTELQAHGFVVDTPDDYTTALSATTVMYSPGNEQAAVTVAAAFGHPHIERVTGLGENVHVVLGSDFATVGAPVPSGSPVRVDVTHGSSSTPTHLPEDLTVTNGADTTCE